MDEAARADVEPDVAEAVEEDEVARAGARARATRLPDAEVGVRAVRQVEPEVAEDVARRARSSRSRCSASRRRSGTGRRAAAARSGPPCEPRLGGRAEVRQPACGCSALGERRSASHGVSPGSRPAAARGRAEHARPGEHEHEHDESEASGQGSPSGSTGDAKRRPGSLGAHSPADAADGGHHSIGGFGLGALGGVELRAARPRGPRRRASRPRPRRARRSPRRPRAARSPTST